MSELEITAILATTGGTGFEIQTILSALAASIAYSVTFYVKKRAKKEKQTFDPQKFIATILVGIGVGLTIELSGASLDFLTFEGELATLVGTIAIVESLIKTVYREVQKRVEQSS